MGTRLVFFQMPSIANSCSIPRVEHFGLLEKIGEQILDRLKGQCIGIVYLCEAV